jgi:L-cysteine/cystine lyase
VDPTALRSEFPVLDRTAYLNAGTCGPIPRRAVEAAAAAAREEAELGRSGEQHRERLLDGFERLRAGYARWLGASPGDLALTGSTTDGVNSVLSGLDLRPGDEVLTTDEEHPGVLAPLASARVRRGIEVRVVPFGEVAGAVGPGTRLVACSHISWVSGRVVDAAALAAAGVPVLLDGAQALGAVPLDVASLGCDFYAASGQKWLCGPDGTGCLWVRPGRLGELAVPWPSYISLADAERALELDLHPDARRLDLGGLSGSACAWALASLELLDAAGREAVTARGPELAAQLAGLLAERGREPARRGRSTLVAWRSPDPEEEVARLAAAAVVVRQLPGRGLVRASVGAWSSQEDLERLSAGAA